MLTAPIRTGTAIIHRQLPRGQRHEPAGLHLAFDVDPATFDLIWARLRAGEIPFGNHPAHPDNGRIDHPLCPRGLFFTDEARNLYEVMSPA